MKTTYRSLILIAAALTLPFTLGKAQTFLEFNNSASNTVGGSPQTINIAAGGSFTLSLQINSSVPTNAVDYWLSQFSGPTANVFSITARDYTGSLFSDPSATDSQVTASTDTKSNSTAGGGSDGVADNILGPRNGFDLGSTRDDSTGDNPPGTSQIATFTISVSPSAAGGTYDLRSFDYAGFGWSSTTIFDQPFASQAEINVAVTAAVPEPTTWALLVLGGVGTLGLTTLCRRHRS